MKALSILFAIIFLTAPKEPLPETQRFPEFYKFILKNYRVGTQQKSDCKLYNASVILWPDKSNRIVDFEVKSEFSEEIKSSLSFIKGYQFPQINKINEKPILFFLTFDLQEICPTMPSSSNNTNTVLKETLAAIEEQLKTNPQTIVLYEVVPIKIFKPRH